MDTVTYATLPVFKEYLKIPASDTTRDTLLTIVLQSASREIDDDTGRRFALDATPSPRVIDARMRTDDDGRLLVPDIGDLTGLVVEQGGLSTWTVVTGTVEPWSPTGWPVTTRLVRTPGWVRGDTARVRVTARWGWPEVPRDVELATLIRAAALFARQDSTDGVVGSGEWGQIRVSARTDPDYYRLIHDYVIPRFARDS